MSRLDVAVFNTQPPHLYSGGVERRIIEVSKRLSIKTSTKVYCGTKKGFNKISSVNRTVFIPCFSTDVFFPIDNWFFNKTIFRMFDAIKADVYEAHAVSGYGFLNAIRKRRVALPFVQTIHGVLADEYVQSSKSESPTLRTKLSIRILWQLAKIEENSAKNATRIVTVSEYSSKKIVQFYNIDRAQIRIAPNGVDPQMFRPIEGLEKLKSRIGIDSRQCVLFVGRLIPRKGLHFLIEAAKQVTKENREIMFVIVGDGPLKNHLISYAERERLSDNFVFLGDVSEGTLPILYNCADVFVSPSIQEGQGMTLLEAQATAKPVVAFDVGGVSEIILDKQTGRLIKPDQIELAKVLLNLLSDKSLREKMGRSGREFVCRNFSWDACAQRMFEVYNEALTEAKQTSNME